ncbi:MAG: hypothetical protein AB8G99_21690 [Planctomycetaceae bacterium]
MSEHTGNRTVSITIRTCLCAMLVMGVVGCRFNVGVLRSVLGDTLVASSFEARTGTDLTKSEDRLLILCTAGQSVLDESASLPVDVVTKVAGHLRVRGIDVVDPDEVANWLDDTGSLDDMSGLATELEADYIAVIQLQSLSHKESGSIDLFKARATGRIAVYEVVHDEENRIAMRYETALNESYPRASPIAAHTTSEGMFRKQTLDYLSEVIARQFHSYHPRETI